MQPKITSLWDKLWTESYAGLSEISMVILKLRVKLTISIKSKYCSCQISLESIGAWRQAQAVGGSAGNVRNLSSGAPWSGFFPSMCGGYLTPPPWHCVLHPCPPYTHASMPTPSCMRAITSERVSSAITQIWIWNSNARCHSFPPTLYLIFNLVERLAKPFECWLHEQLHEQ